MMSVAANRRVTRQIDQVFDYVADLRNESKWNPGARQVVKLDDGPVRVGSRFEADYQGAGKLAVRVLECDHPRLLRYLSVGRSMRFTSDIRCAEVPDGTLVNLTMQVEPLGLLKVLSPLLGVMLRRQFSANADRLKAALDAGS